MCRRFDSWSFHSQQIQQQSACIFVLYEGPRSVLNGFDATGGRPFLKEKSADSGGRRLSTHDLYAVDYAFSCDDIFPVGGSKFWCTVLLRHRISNVLQFTVLEPKKIVAFFTNGLFFPSSPRAKSETRSTRVFKMHMERPNVREETDERDTDKYRQLFEEFICGCHIVRKTRFNFLRSITLRSVSPALAGSKSARSP